MPLQSGLVDAQGKPVKPSELLQAERATVFVFTRSECPIANRYAPTINALCNTYAPQGVDFYLVYVSPKENSATIQKHIEDYQYVCRGLHDPLHELVKLTGATRTPEAAMFTINGKLAYLGRIDNLFVKFGEARDAATIHDLADALDAVLAGKQIETLRTEAIGCYIGDLH